MQAGATNAQMQGMQGEGTGEAQKTSVCGTGSRGSTRCRRAAGRALRSGPCLPACLPACALPARNAGWRQLGGAPWQVGERSLLAPGRLPGWPTYCQLQLSAGWLANMLTGWLTCWLAARLPAQKTSWSGLSMTALSESRNSAAWAPYTTRWSAVRLTVICRQAGGAGEGRGQGEERQDGERP